MIVSGVRNGYVDSAGSQVRMHREDPRLACALEPALEVNSGITQNAKLSRLDSGRIDDCTAVEPLGVTHKWGVRHLVRDSVLLKLRLSDPTHARLGRQGMSALLSLSAGAKRRVPPLCGI